MSGLRWPATQSRPASALRRLMSARPILAEHSANQLHREESQ